MINDARRATQCPMLTGDIQPNEQMFAPVKDFGLLVAVDEKFDLFNRPVVEMHTIYYVLYTI